MGGATLLVAALVAAPLAGQPRPLDEQEFQVNDSTRYDQLAPKVVLAADGTAMFVWETEYFFLHFDQRKVQARLFGADGLPRGGQFRVHQSGQTDSRQPAISGDGARGFVVVWQSGGAAPDPGSFWGLLARRFARDGEPRGDEFPVDSTTNGDQFAPAVAARAGQFAVAWVDCWSGGGGPCPASVELRRFESDETPLGGQLELFAPVPNQSEIALASSATGSLVVWIDLDAAVGGQFLDPDGAPVGLPIELAEFALRFSVAIDASGSFVVAWLEPSDIPDLYLVRARLFDPFGSPRGEPFQVDQPGADPVAWWASPRVAMDASGDFVVVWESVDVPPGGPSVTSSNIQARRFDSEGVAQGGQFRVNVLTDNEQNDPAVASDGIGNFVVTWSSWGSFGDDDDQHSIQARRFSCGLFCDGFERGDRSAWSESRDARSSGARNRPRSLESDELAIPPLRADLGGRRHRR